MAIANYKFSFISYLLILFDNIGYFSNNIFNEKLTKNNQETVIKASFVENSEHQIDKTGSVLFQFDSSGDRYISSEAPLNKEIFLKTIWNKNVDTFVTLTNEGDNNLIKIKLMRGGIKTDLHHLYNLSGVNGDFFVTRPKIIERFNGVAILQSEVMKGDEIRVLTQILCYDWNDRAAPEQEMMDFLVEMVQKYHNIKKPLFVNCFLGIGRTRFLISVLHSRLSCEPIDKINFEYFNKNYNKKIIEKGEFLYGFKDKNSTYYKLLTKYAKNNIC